MLLLSYNVSKNMTLKSTKKLREGYHEKKAQT